MADEERKDAPKDEQVPEETAAAEEPTTEEAPAEETPAEGEPTAEESPAEEPVAEAPEPEATEEAETSEPEAAEAPEAAESVEEPEAAEAPEADAADAAGEADAEGTEEAERPKPKAKRERKKDGKGDEPEVIPGAHLEPDLVLEEAARAPETDEFGVEIEAGAEGDATDGESEDKPPEPLKSAVLELAADARYRATGKRKRAIARVTIKPGTGVYTINGKTLNEYFPRATLQTQARRPLETVGQQERMDVVAKIHGGGVSAQAGALRHGITRALVEADPTLRGELKRRGFLTRDPRVKERKKAGLKKARKRPQFSKR
jgi:small subunit ribosomal protein S9